MAATQLLLPNEHWQTLFDLSSKIITYYTELDMLGRVKTQIVNAGDGSSSNCGCGSAPSGFRLGKRFDYLYRRYEWAVAPVEPGWTGSNSPFLNSNGYSVQVVESRAEVQNNDLAYVPYRVRTNDYFWQSFIFPGEMQPRLNLNIVEIGSGKGIVKIAEVLSEANPLWNFDHLDLNVNDPSYKPVFKPVSGKHWITMYEYFSQTDPTDQTDPDTEFTNFRKAARTITASAIKTYEYIPALGIDSPVLPSVKVADGLIYTSGYDNPDGTGTSGWVTSSGVQHGNEGLVQVLTSYVREDEGTSRRPDLANKVLRHRSQTLDDVETTSISYHYYANTDNSIVHWSARSVSLESVEQNGPALRVDPTVTQVYDRLGQLRWTYDETGDSEYREYDPLTGKLTRVIQDADPMGLYDPAANPGLLASVTLPPIRDPAVEPYEELQTLYEYDLLGRMTTVTDPGGVSMYYRYEYRTSDTLDDSLSLVSRWVPFMTRVSFPHELQDGSFDGPISITWQDANGQSIRKSSYIASDGGGLYDPVSGQFAEGTEVQRSDDERILSGLTSRRRAWHDIVNKKTYVTKYEYDTLGRIFSITDPEGGVVQYGTNAYDGYDILDRSLIVSQGTEADGVSVISRTYFDSPQDATQGVGNGNVTLQQVFTGESVGAIRETKHWYDFRDRLIGTQNPMAPHQSMAYDDLNRVIERASWTDSTFSTVAPVPSTVSSTKSVYSQSLYNNRGLLYKSRIAIDPTNVSTEFLESNIWFDAEGLVIASWSPNGPITKFSYDSLDRLSVKYVSDRAGDVLPGAGSYESADNLIGDHVIAQTEYSYLPGGVPGAGGIDLMTARSRLHDAVESGASEVTEALDSTNSIAVFSAYVRDDAGRVIDSLNYGTNSVDFAAGTTTPISYDSDRATSSALISSIGFDEWGRTRVSIDHEGKESITKYDDLSRTVAVIESAVSLDETHIVWNTDNWAVTWPIGAPADQDRVTTFAYDGLSNVVKRTAHLNDDTTQVTQYDYGTVAGAGSNTMDTLIGSSSLLSAVHYPNEGSGQADLTPEYTVSYAYNMLGEVRGMTDQNATLHAYGRDDLGRVLADSVTITDTNLDSTIDAIEVAYDGHGRVLNVLSMASTTIINGVSLEYTPLHQVQRVYQNADGDPDLPGVESIAYAYDNQDPASAGGNFSRLAKVWYPTEVDVAAIAPGTVLTASSTGETMSIDYTGVINDRISRVNGMDVPGWNGLTNELVRYAYLGRSTPVQTSYPLIDVGLDYTKSWTGADPADAYPGFDQYGRVVWHGWVKGAFSPGGNPGYPDRTPHMARRYAYDTMSNRIRDWDGRPGAATSVPKDKDWEYQYDELDRLETASRGARAAFDTGGTFTKANGSQQWALDMLGNWDSITTDINTDWAFDVSDDVDPRVHNQANEIIGFDIGGGASTLSPTYDPAGNFKLNTASAGPNALRYVHDAWNRLVRIETNPSVGSAVSVLENEFNGLNWRTKRRVDLSTAAYDGVDEERVYYYSAGWQMIEEEVDTDMVIGEEYTSQQFWGGRSIDDAVAKRIDRNNDRAWTDIASRYHYLTDVMFSVRALVKEDGMIAERG